MTERERFVREASGHYLCDHYPENYTELSEDELLDFIGGNLWEPFEYCDACDVAAYIESAGYASYRLFVIINEEKKV